PAERAAPADHRPRGSLPSAATARSRRRGRHGDQRRTAAPGARAAERPQVRRPVAQRAAGCGEGTGAARRVPGAHQSALARRTRRLTEPARMTPFAPETAAVFKELMAELTALDEKFSHGPVPLGDEQSVLEGYKWIFTVAQVALDVNVWADT